MFFAYDFNIFHVLIYIFNVVCRVIHKYNTHTYTSQIAKHYNTHFSLSHWIYIWIYFPLFHFFPILDDVHQFVSSIHTACVLVTYLNKKKFSVSVGYKKQQIFMLNMIMLLVQFIWKECILVSSQLSSIHSVMAYQYVLGLAFTHRDVVIFQNLEWKVKENF